MSKQVRAWMHMTATGSDYPLPSSEQSYMAHKHLIDTVIVPNGGTLQADGTWSQGSFDAFAQGLKTTAQDSGQRYVVGVDAGHILGTDNFKTVLNDSDLQQTAIDNALALALTNRFDSPWDGVMLDIPWLESEWYDKLHDFLYLFSNDVRTAGLPFEIAYIGIIEAHDPYTPSLDVFAQVADRFDYYMYAWWEDPKSLGPYWWARSALENALQNHGVPNNRTYLGIANYARYWPVTGEATFHEISLGQAQQLINDNNSFIQWRENHLTGLLREQYADVGTGHIWFHDGDVNQHRIDLVKEFDLPGIMVFCPGFGNGSVWSIIARWKNKLLGRMTAQRLRGIDGVFTRG